MDISQQIYDLVDENEAATIAFQILRGIGGNVYVVGGAIRDLILGKNPKDIDLLVTGVDSNTIEQTLQQYGHVNFAGNNFGVYHFRSNMDSVEIAMPRVETSTGHGHKDFAVTPHQNIPVEVDLGRRDFTVNSMAFDLNSGQLIDPYQGANDAQAGRLRLVNPSAFKEDPLRLLRGIGAQARHDLVPEPDLIESMMQHADKIRNLPPERIQMELDKILDSSNPAEAIELAAATGVLDYILPEVTNAMGFEQNNPYHDLAVGEHLIEVLRAMTGLSSDPDLRLAALLHDIGKPDSYWEDEKGQGHFYQHPDYEDSQDHEDVGAEMAQEIMERLHYPTDRIKRVVSLIQHHMFDYLNSERGARRHLNNLGGDQQMALDLMKLRGADARGKSGNMVEPLDEENIARSNQLLQNVIDQQNATTVGELAITGYDLMELGIPQGPEIGEVLRNLLDIIIDEPSLNSREDLLQLAKQYAPRAS